MAAGTGADSLPDEVGLAALVHRIQTGDQGAIQDLHSTFATGIAFLLRRNLRKSSVAAEVANVLEAVVSDIQRSSGTNLCRIVSQAINRQFPPVTAGMTSTSADTPAEGAAQLVLAERTPLERDILKRYYILRETPSTIQRRLRVSSGTIQKTLASARADFRRRAQRTD